MGEGNAFACPEPAGSCVPAKGFVRVEQSGKETCRVHHYQLRHC